jgi:hypothetical protein
MRSVWSLSGNARFTEAVITYSFLIKEERMKRFWLVLLSLGLVMAFSVSAFAVDVKISAEYYAAGVYLNKTQVNDGYAVTRWWMDGATNPSTAFFYQRLRMGTDFVVSPCLKLVTRFDAMERIWGGKRSPVGTEDAQSAGTRAENENIAIDLVYIDYTSPIGLFRVGYQPDYVWGTVFGDRASGPSAGTLTYAVPVGPVTVVAQYAKEADNSASAVISSSKTDLDHDSYRIGAIYNFKGSNASGEVGALLLYDRIAGHKSDTAGGGFYDVGFMTRAYKVIPYFKANVGPVALQGEFEYTFGDAVKGEDAALANPAIGNTPNASIGAISVWLDAVANLGMFYVGGTFTYLSGDDPTTKDKVEGGVFHGIGINTAGLDWHPCLILFNTDLNYWAGNIYGHDGTVANAEMSNVWFGQLRGGVKPTPQLDIMLAASYAQVDKKPTGYNGGTYGTEIDLTGTYKITNNLSYMLGAGYLFTGDYFKADEYLSNHFGGASVTNDYILINKLTLTF